MEKADHTPNIFTGSNILSKLSQLPGSYVLALGSISGNSQIPPAQTHITDATKLELAFTDVEVEPGDAESFLAQTARLGIASEAAWRHLGDTLDAIEQSFAGNYIGKDLFGNIIMSRSNFYMTEAVTDVGAGLTLDIAKECRNKITKDEVIRIASLLGNQEAIDSFDLMARISEEGITDWKAQQLQGPTAYVDPDQVDAAKPVQDLYAGYIYAYATQHLYTEQIATFLQTDANVEPFVTRLQEIIELRKAGINEYPGLLETLNTLISLQQNEEGALNLEKAIMRTGTFRETLDNFTRRVLTETSPNLQGTIPKEFAAMLRGVKMSYQAMVESGHITQEDFIETFVRQLPSLSGSQTWRDTYNVDSTTRAQAQWRQLLRDIHTYEHRGRLPGYMLSQQHSTQPLPEPRNTRKRMKQARRPSMTDTDIRDLATPIEEIVTEARLTVMKSKGSGNEHSLQFIDDLDELMEHTLVMNFLRPADYENRLKDTVRASLQRLQHFSIDPRASMVVTKQTFHIDDPNCTPGKLYRMRRFRPDRAIGLNLSDPLARRIRILYGVVPSKVGNLLTLKTLDLRDENTY